MNVISLGLKTSLLVTFGFRPAEPPSLTIDQFYIVDGGRGRFVVVPEERDFLVDGGRGRFIAGRA